MFCLKLLLLFLTTIVVGYQCETLISSGKNDEVTNLPGIQFKLHFKHYSGYLKSLNGSQLYYWFFESQNDPANDPVVLWLNGGPGCSSLLGALTENGPFLYNMSETLHLNPYAWNMKTNVLYLESPPGVGYSYNTENDYEANDDKTAQLNFEALKSFYQKFPQYNNNSFYITGESYAGIYIPTLAKLLIDNRFPVQFRAMAIGNGYFDRLMLYNSMIRFAYSHGILGKQIWNDLVDACCKNVTNVDQCNFVNSNNLICGMLNLKIIKILENPIIDYYNIYADYEVPTPQQVASKLVRKTLLTHLGQVKMFDEVSTSKMDFLKSMDNYLNNKLVRNALHINSNSPTWHACSNISYTSNYDSMTETVRYVLDHGIKALIYNGDIDAVCNFLGDAWFAENLGYKTIKGYGPWFVDRQVGGFYTVYDNFAFTTVRGSGHMVPTDKPAAGYHMFNTFIRKVESGDPQLLF